MFLLVSLNSSWFLSVGDLARVPRNLPFLAFKSVGVGLVQMAGEMGMSVGSICTLAGVATALTQAGMLVNPVRGLDEIALTSCAPSSLTLDVRNAGANCGVRNDRLEVVQVCDINFADIAP
jgi:ribose/xylose/arabinose/galactoside ABC-type transport system permease subunit